MAHVVRIVAFVAFVISVVRIQKDVEYVRVVEAIFDVIPTIISLATEFFIRIGIHVDTIVVAALIGAIVQCGLVFTNLQKGVTSKHLLFDFGLAAATVVAAGFFGVSGLLIAALAFFLIACLSTTEQQNFVIFGTTSPSYSPKIAFLRGAHDFAA